MLRRRLLLAGVLAGGAVQAGLAAHSARVGGILDHRYSLLVEIGLWALASAVTVVCLLRLPRRLAVGLLLGLALVVRLAALSEKAPLSDDLYRYAWDGAVQSSGTSPYRHPPTAPELEPLRDLPGMSWIWPDDGSTLINRPSVRTIYPPVAEAWFWLEHQVVPLTARDLGYELVGLGLDLLVVLALLALLRSRGDPRWAAYYAVTPLPVLEAVQNAHVDVLAVLLVLGAVAAERSGRVRAAVGLVALAALVKVYPAVLLPAVVRRQRPLALAGSAALALGIAALAYLPHVLAVGTSVLGYLPGYLTEEQYATGDRFLLVPLPGEVASAVVAGLLVAVVLWALRSARPLPEVAVRLLAVVLLLVTPVQPWYALLLVALVALTGWWPGLAVAAAGYPLFFAVILDGPGDVVGRWSYGLAALVVAAALLREGLSGGAAAAAPPRRLPARP